MRNHGILNYPDPGAGVGAAMRKVDLSSPQYRAAMKVCLKILPNGGGIPSTPLPPKVLAEALKFTQCMRSHGVPNWPDPTSTYYVVASSGPNSSLTERKAADACKGLLPKQ